MYPSQGERPAGGLYPSHRLCPSCLFPARFDTSANHHSLQEYSCSPLLHYLKTVSPQGPRISLFITVVKPVVKERWYSQTAKTDSIEGLVGLSDPGGPLWSFYAPWSTVPLRCLYVNNLTIIFLRVDKLLIRHYYVNVFMTVTSSWYRFPFV